jgi:hypothetical protein
MISSDNLLSHEDRARFQSLLDDHKNGRHIKNSDKAWMVSQNELAYKKYLGSSPDLYADGILEDDSLMHEFEKNSADFKDASQCFGFNMPEYQDAFFQYDQSISELLSERIRKFRPNITNEDQRSAAGHVMDDLPFRAQVAFGTYPRWRFRVPVLTPSTFGAMAGTLMKFEDAVTEVHITKRSAVALYQLIYHL